MRDNRRGIILLTTLLSILLLASIAAVLQAQVRANLIIMARLERQNAAAAADDAIHDRMRVILGDVTNQMPTDIPSFNLRGEPFQMEENGAILTIKLNDVDALVDVYLASPTILGLLPKSAAINGNMREKFIRDLPEGRRYPTLATTLALLGFDLQQRESQQSLFTQTSESGQIRAENAPADIADAIQTLPTSERKVGPVSRIRIIIQGIEQTDP